MKTALTLPNDQTPPALISTQNLYDIAPSRGLRGNNANPAVHRLVKCAAFYAVCLVALCSTLSGCTPFSEYIRNGFKVGPNFEPPPAPLAAGWIDQADVRVRKDSDDLSRWWKVFNDPIFDELTCFAYHQNLTLRQAGFRILEAREQLAIARGDLFPQTQQSTGSYMRRESPVPPGSSAKRFSSQWNFGFNLAWEVDFWGRFRRAVESANDTLEASVYDYNDVLVTLLSDVATNYVQMRTLEQRIAYAVDNVKLQQETLKVTEARFRAGTVGQLDIDQARSILAQTQAAIPQLEITLRQTTNQLCILLGIPPEELRTKLKAAPIPTAPVEVAVGIPADLLRRRPDVRRAEFQAAAQSAQIGIAEADFYPRITLMGSLGWSAADLKDLFRSTSMTGSVGPSFQWSLLNYGRILSNVRLQDARFQELATGYQNAVLTAQQEVENGLINFLKSQERAKFQSESVEYAQKSVKIVLAQYEAGTVDFTRVTQLEQNLVQEQDTLAQVQGQIPTGLIQVYRAVGGGWQTDFTNCASPSLTSPPSTSPQNIETLPLPRVKLGDPKQS